MKKCEHYGKRDYCEYAESLNMKMKCPLDGDWTRCKNSKHPDKTCKTCSNANAPCYREGSFCKNWEQKRGEN